MRAFLSAPTREHDAARKAASPYERGFRPVGGPPRGSMQRQRRARYDLSLCPVPLRSAPRARLPLTFLALLAIAAHAGAAMTLDERIACREKVEDVYWAHRLWPKENQGQKPAREAVAPHATIAARVEESLRYETAIGELWQEALSPQVIQAEMDREARATPDPPLLPRLWAAPPHQPPRVARCPAPPAP